MGRKRKPRQAKPSSERVEFFRNTILSQLECKRKELLSRKNGLIFEVDQLFEYTSGEFGDMLNTKLGDVTDRLSSVTVDEENIDLGLLPPPATTIVPKKTTKDVARESEFGNEYKTPYSKTLPQIFITPKVNPLSPPSILRIPQHGEFAVSAAGSPLQVSCMNNETASVCIPLKNGKVMSVLPKPGINTKAIHKHLEPSVKQQLVTLQNAISQILQE